MKRTKTQSNKGAVMTIETKGLKSIAEWKTAITLAVLTLENVKRDETSTQEDIENFEDILEDVLRNFGESFAFDQEQESKNSPADNSIPTPF